MKISNNQLKYIKSLHQPKFRQMYENFMAEGDKVVMQLLSSNKFEMELIAATTHWIENHNHVLRSINDKVYELEPHQMEKITALKTATDVIAVLKKSEVVFNNSLIENGFSFYLDGVQDPGNVGTIIRVADWFGFKAVIKSEDSVDFYNPKVVQATMGSIGNVNLFSINRSDLGSINVPLLLTDMKGENLSSIKKISKAIIVLGREGSGVSDQVWSIANKKIISILGSESSNAESLNVSIAAGIIAYELSKKN